MGFFGNLLSGIKKIGKSIATGVYNVGSGIRRTVGKAYNFVRNIPVVGSAVDAAASMPLAFLGGRSVKDVGNIASKGVDLAGSVARGDLAGSARNGLSLVGQIRR